MHMYWRGFPTRVIGHPDSSVGSVHVAFWPSMKRNIAGRVLKQQASHHPKPKGKGVWSQWLKVWPVGQQHWCCLDLVRSADSQAHTMLSELPDFQQESLGVWWHTEV